MGFRPAAWNPNLLHANFHGAKAPLASIISYLSDDFVSPLRRGKILFPHLFRLRIPLSQHSTAGDGIRTHDVQLGKLALYH